ncbi:hypothetical protein L1887_61128 [Cichorium endivia]|nr:hypothetical protein L1887_61128 [Cichorium endivia]
MNRKPAILASELLLQKSARSCNGPESSPPPVLRPAPAFRRGQQAAPLKPRQRVHTAEFRLHYWRIAATFLWSTLCCPKSAAAATTAAQIQAP